METPPSADARRDAAAALTAVPVDLWAEDLRWRHPVDLWADLAPIYPQVDSRRLLEDGADDGWRFLLPGDPQWPAVLTCDLRPGPVGLWVHGFGDLAVLADRSVTITGSRTSTGYGTQVAADLAAALAPRWVDRPVTVAAAGTGDGVDAAALRAAAATGTAIAVLATTSELTGENEDLFEEITTRGGLVVCVTAPGTARHGVHALARARTLAVLTRGTVLVESPPHGGAWETACTAWRYRRRVMAVPGPITAALSEGPHRLLAEGTARMVTGPDDIRTHLDRT
ncbi:hypothetical protein ACG83_41165 [Frankia sp. R43]|nr:hypothetical protein ACG83_41165 [Frankia sp. R43]